MSTLPEELLAEAQVLRGVLFEALREVLPTEARVLRLVGSPEGSVAPLALLDPEALVLDVVPLTPQLLAVLSRFPRLRALEVDSDRAPLQGWASGFSSLELLSLPNLAGGLGAFEPLMRSLPLLRVLRVKDAELRELPAFLFELPMLRELDLRGAPVPDEALEELRAARPGLLIHTSPINLGWAPGVRGVLHVADGFPVDDIATTEGWHSGVEVSVRERQVMVRVRWEESPADAPNFQQEIHGPVSVESFVRDGPPVALRPRERANLRRHLEARLGR